MLEWGVVVRWGGGVALSAGASRVLGVAALEEPARRRATRLDRYLLGAETRSLHAL